MWELWSGGKWGEKISLSLFFLASLASFENLHILKQAIMSVYPSDKCLIVKHLCVCVFVGEVFS